MKLIEEIIATAKANSETLAFVEADRSFTYRELFDAVSQLTETIQSRQLTERPILVFGANDFRTLAAMLAASLSGHAYIPVDAHTPLPRLEMILSVAKPSLIIATAALSADYDSLLTDRIDFLDFEAAAAFDFEQLDTTSAISGDDTDYIIFTSGTTGTPKGVAVSHDNLASFTHWMNKDFEQIEKNQFLEQALYSFDLSIFSIYPCLTQGGTLQSLSHDETTNFKHLFERLNRTKLSTWISTPSFVDICLMDPSFTEAQHPDLKQFIFCGEELTHKTAEKLLAAFPNAAVYNTYGPTEATGAVTSIKITAEVLEKYSRLPLGQAKPGVDIELMDNEIIISGDSVAKGYFENSEKTAAAFFEKDGQSAYHTGDAGFFDDSGILNYKGRIDFQVKYNGFRIELQDIEANLLSLPEVKQAVVLARENEQHKVTGLIAFLSVTEEAPDRVFTKALKQELSPLIMDYMMPTKFIYLDSFPLNHNEKIDRKALMEML